jgi:hypothetical protein
MAPRRNENVVAATISSWTQHCAGPCGRSFPPLFLFSHPRRAREVQTVCTRQIATGDGPMSAVLNEACTPLCLKCVCVYVRVLWPQRAFRLSQVRAGPRRSAFTDPSDPSRGTGSRFVAALSQAIGEKETAEGCG